MKLDKALIEEPAVHPGHPAGLDGRNTESTTRGRSPRALVRGDTVAGDGPRASVSGDRYRTSTPSNAICVAMAPAR